MKAGFLKCKAGPAELLLSWSVMLSRQHGTECDMALPALQGKTLPLLLVCPNPTGPPAGPPSHPWLAAGSTVPSRPLRAFDSGQTPLGQVPSTGTKAESPSDGPGSWGRVQLPAQLLSSAANQRGIEVNHPLVAFVTAGAAQGCPGPGCRVPLRGALVALSGWVPSGRLRWQHLLLDGPLPALSLQAEPTSLTPLVPAGQHRALAMVPGLSQEPGLPSKWHSKF